MSIQSEIERLTGAKNNIATSIENQGVTVPSDALLSDMPSLIDQITGDVTSVNGKTGDVVLGAADVGALASDVTYVESVNGSSGAVTIVVPSGASEVPQDLGVAAIGSSSDWARADHVHAIDTSRASAAELSILENGLAIVIDGNETSYASGAAIGNYVFVKNSTITDITDGMHKAKKVIPANTAIDSTYLTKVDNALSVLNNKVVFLSTQTVYNKNLAKATSFTSTTINVNIPAGDYLLVISYVGKYWTTGVLGAFDYNGYSSTFSSQGAGCAGQLICRITTSVQMSSISLKYYFTGTPNSIDFDFKIDGIKLN